MTDAGSEDGSSVKIVCPSADELGMILNQIKCEECNLVFCGEPRFRMHDLKVHQRKNLDKISKENVRYHCPVENCIYAPNNKKHFLLYKYLKQHYLKVHAEKKFSCTQCTKSFSTNAAKEAHMRICGTNFICECQKVFTSYEALLTHAKRSSHRVDDKYRSNKSQNKKINNPNNIPTLLVTVVNGPQIELRKEGSNPIPIPILPKPTSSVGVQTDEITTITKSTSSKSKSSENHVCRQTQTNEALKEKQNKKSAETQTAKAVPRVIRVRQVGKRKKISIDKHSVIREDVSLVETLSSEYILPDSPFSLKHDIILQDLWEDKSTLGTQTSPEKNIFGDLEDYTMNSMQNVEFSKITRSDPMLTEETYRDKYSSIETQTEKGYCKSIFESDQLSSNNETQTTENYIDYNNTYTQTCDEIFSPDLVLSDIQTQTAWNHLDESTVSAETQTKALKCLSGCDSNSWFATQTNHMETQTDLLNIFEELE